MRERHFRHCFIGRKFFRFSPINMLICWGSFFPPISGWKRLHEYIYQSPLHAFYVHTHTTIRTTKEAARVLYSHTVFVQAAEARSAAASLNFLKLLLAVWHSILVHVLLLQGYPTIPPVAFFGH